MASQLASAQATCAQPYPLDVLLDDMGEVESGLASGTHGLAGGAATRMRTRIVCVEEPLPAIIGARTLRAIGAGLLVRQHVEALGWLESAAAADPEYRYTLENLAELHPLFPAWGTVLDRASLAQPELRENRELAPGEHWLDGMPLTEPVAHPNVPHVYQHRAAEGRPLRTEIMVGTEFPSGALVVREGRRAVVDTTRGKDRAEPEDVPAPLAPGSGVDVVVVRPKAWPSERVALVSGGLSAIAGSALLYALSTQTEANFLASTNTRDIDRYRGATNRLAVGSGAAAAVGVSALSFGLLFYVVDGDPRPSLDIRF